MNILRNVYAGIAEIFFKPFKNLGNKKLPRFCHVEEFRL